MIQALTTALVVLLACAPHVLAYDDVDSPDALPGNVIYECDFTNATASAVREKGGKGTIQGSIHPDWSLHNSANFANEVTATVMEDDGMTQRKFWRLESTKTEPHNRALLMLWQEWVMPLPNDEMHQARVSYQVRGTPGVRVRVSALPRGTKTEFALNGQWQNLTLSLTVHADKNDPDAKFGLRFDVDGAGHDEVSMDLTEMQVRMISATEMKEAAARRVPEGGYPPNTMRVSRFPLGLPFGWTPLTADYPSIYFHSEADPETKGPSGYPTLKVTATSEDLDRIRRPGRGVRFTSAPLDILDPSRPHVFSVWVRGEGRLGVNIHRKWTSVAGASIDLKNDDGWQRVEVPFSPSPMDEQLMNVWFDYDTKPGQAIWLDALQLEPGEKASDYQAQHGAEVQMALPGRRQVQFADQPAEAMWAVTGAAEGSILNLRVVNAYGQKSDVQQVELNGDPLQVGNVSYLKWPDRPLGQFRVEAWVERDGQRVSPYDEVIVTRLREPRYWGKDAPDSPFAAHFNAHPETAWTAKAMGLNWVRDWNSHWKSIVAKEGDWRDRRERLQVYRDAQIFVMPVLAEVPDWAKAQFQGLKPTDYPKELSLYGEFVADFVEFHKGNVAAVEVFNEPWIRQNFNKGVPVDGGKYVEWDNAFQRFDDLTRIASEYVDRVDPSVLVVGINTHQADEAWTRGMLEVDGLSHCDVASYHMYSFGRGIPGDAFERVIREPLDPIIEANPDFPMWMTEGSATPHMMGTGLIEHIAPGEQHDGEIMQRSDRHIRYTLTQLALGVDRIFYYTMGGGGFYEAQTWGWRVFMGGTGTLWPEAAAVSNMAWHLEDTDFVRTAELGDGTFVYLFERADDRSAVGVIVYDMATIDPPTYHLAQGENLAYEDLFGNPLQPGELLPRTATFVAGATSVDELQKMLQ